MGEVWWVGGRDERQEDASGRSMEDTAAALAGERWHPVDNLLRVVSLQGCVMTAETRSISFVYNGEPRQIEADPNMPLLWALRDVMGQLGTRFGCGIGQCGACTVLLNDSALRSCSLPVSAVEGQRVTTIEGLAEAGLGALQDAWIDVDVPQCGYCQVGQIMATAALLKSNPAPSDADIDDAITNLCRCGTYPRIREAIHRSARTLRVAGEGQGAP